MNKVKLGDYIEAFGDGIHGTPVYDENGEYFFINGNNLIDGEITIDENTLRVSKTEYEKIKRPLGENTLLLSINGTLGRVAEYKNEKIALGKSACFLNIKDNVNKDFIRYVMLTQEFQKYILLVAHGSTIKNLAPSQVADYEFSIPDSLDVNRMADLLKVIDNKIKNNKKINAELESMAKTIYDYWFLQFEFPNEEGKPYKSSGGKMLWNEELKREIPEGWEVSHVKDCIKHINTGLNPRDNFVLGNGSIKYITVKNLTTDGTIDFSGCDMIDEEARAIVHNRSDVSKNDILFASIAPLGRCAIVHENPTDWDINESVFCIRPNNHIVSTEYLYMFFMSDYFIKKAEHNSTGSVFSGIRISSLEDMIITIPPEKIKDNFVKAIRETLYMKYENEKQNQELASLRDFLLPMLMNGQIGFKDGER